jgi:hypothetical protein
MEPSLEDVFINLTSRTDEQARKARERAIR